MGVTKGDENELSSEKSNQDIIRQMSINMELMQKELAEFKKDKNVQNFSTGSSGLTSEQMAQLVAAVVKASKTQPDAILSATDFVNERDIDKDDWDEDGVIFCGYSNGYFIADDKRNGFPVRTPYGNVIVLMFQGFTKTRDNNGKEVLNTFCAYLSKSKKEQQWLRDHSFFGIKFFESAKEALSQNAERAQKLTRFINVVMGMTQDAIITNCKAYKVNISEDMRAMRVGLANKMLDAVEEKEGGSIEYNATKKLITETYAEDDLFIGGGKLHKSVKK